MSNENIESLAYRERRCLSNSNPVLVARHFSTGKKCFLNKILVMVHYGRLAVILFAKNSKFLAHHMHIVFCGLSMHVAFVDQIVHAFLPDKHGN